MKQLVTGSLFVLIFAAACSNAPTEKKEPSGGGGNVDGGGCRYRNDTAIAEVIKINKIDTNRYDILFALSGGRIAADTLHYAKEKKGLLSEEELKKMDIKAGDHYPYITSTIISGHCNPEIRQLVMEKIK
jgi:hypothetical protein